MRKTEINTPGLLLDMAKLKSNLSKMADFAERSGKKLRPHAKTHKCSELAKMQLEYGAVGICAAKVTEAEALVKAGISEILLTSPVVTPAKIEILLGLVAAGNNISVVVDNLANAALLNECAEQQQLKLNILIDIDPEMGRTGVPYERALDFAEQLKMFSRLKVQGIQCYAGLSQHVAGFCQRQQHSLEKLEKAAVVYRKLREQQCIGPVFTTSGTGTYNIDTQIAEITDLQVGSYVFMDAEYAAIGSRHGSECFDDFLPALSILTSVISTNHSDWVTVDAGLKAIYSNPHHPEIINPPGRNWHYQWFGDEHGKIVFPPGEKPPELGSVIELTASHCDPTVNLYDCIYVTDKDQVIAPWDIDLRGKSQ